jgi:K+-transporting ATPase ATPase A chain
MTWIGLCQLAVFLSLLFAITKPLGSYMADVFEGKRTLLSRMLAPLERLLYRFLGIDPSMEQTWTTYAGAALLFSLLNFGFCYALLRLQGLLPLNPQRFGTLWAPSGSTPMTPDLAFSTAVSFMTNTSWQAYPGETTLSHLAQLLGIAVQSFTSAATGMAVAVALIRGFARDKASGLGSFWVDLTRATVYILIPLSLAGALFLCGEGVIQNFRDYRTFTTVEGAHQTIPSGPVASQEAIKLLSSDGGGFFNANSAHPFENPTPLTNLIEMLLMLAIPAGMTYTFGRMVNDRKQGWAIFVAMGVLLVGGACIANWSEQAGNPIVRAAGVNTRPRGADPGGNMEGKEVRFGIAGSALFSIVGTASADGAVDSMHDSYTPLAGLIQMLNLKTGEVIFGGVGSGLISMLFMVLLTVFISGLMVGRTPDYLGKKIEAKEMKMVMVSFVATAVAIQVLSAATVAAPFHPLGYWNPPGPPVANLANRGPHGLSEILYAHSSAAATNGSAFAGLNANTPWFNLTLGLGMLIGRFLVVLPALAIAGSLVFKRRLAATSGTMPTHSPLFVTLLLGTIGLVTVLTFFPVLALGPLAEHFLMRAGVLFR